jgi:hypothetical protein
MENVKTDNHKTFDPVPAKNMGGLGCGIGSYRFSFCKTWLLNGFWYWAVPIFIYLAAAIMVLSMFLPLCKIIEKLG